MNMTNMSGIHLKTIVEGNTPLLFCRAHHKQDGPVRVHLSGRGCRRCWRKVDPGRPFFFFLPIWPGMNGETGWGSALLQRPMNGQQYIRVLLNVNGSNFSREFVCLLRRYHPALWKKHFFFLFFILVRNLNKSILVRKRVGLAPRPIGGRASPPSSGGWATLKRKRTF